MKKLLFLVVAALASTVPAFGHVAFTLVSSEKLSVSDAKLAELQKNASIGIVDGLNLTFADPDIKIVVVTGPEDDMLSFRIQGVRNPNIVTPPNARISVWFVNMDGDMRHDLRFAHYMADFSEVPDVMGSAGTEKLAPRPSEKAPMQAEKIVITSNEDGAYKYFCSVHGHAKGGMWGNILVGEKPGAGMKIPEKTEHHSPDEDKMPGMDMNKGADTKKKPDDMANMPDMKPDDKKKPGDMSSMPGMNNGAMKMASSVSIGDPMERESSGTAWAPDSSPLYSLMKMYDDGSMWMLMGVGFVRYTHVGSNRDVSVAGKGDRNKFDAPTMFMGMYSRPFGKNMDNQFGFRIMASADPILEQGFGYPLLYQSGEQFHGQPIHDRQHPHDLIAELAITLSHKFDEKRSVFFYAGLPGEPALGPPMYLHRVSGMNMPDAPIGHHWQDATHITFGVVTAGFSFGKAKIEASAFNGSEPNENRYNFDKPRLNSFSGRFSYNPTKNLALQMSHGYMKNPEPLEPDVHIMRRTTASALYNKKYDDEHNWASTLVWGQDYVNRERSNSLLFESDYGFFKNSVFGRFETIQKDGHELVLPAVQNDLFRLTTLSVGYVRDITKDKGWDVGVGGMLTADFNPSTLTPFYGGTSHLGWQLYMRIRPSRWH